MIFAVLDDVVLDHRLATDFQNEVIGTGEQFIQLETFVLFDRQSWLPGGYFAQERQAGTRGSTALMIDELYGPRRKSFARNTVLFFKGFEMTAAPLGDLISKASPISRTVGP